MPRRLPQCDDCTPAKPAKVKPSAADEELAALAWAVAHPVRVRILRILIATEGCVCGELVDMLPLAQSTVSQHLKILKEAGLVRGEVDGPKVCYCVDADGLARLKELTAAL
ncbi:MAG TPA: metalloregulator ArsR/SmtB family transcription factor [Gemmataceae bacterium]|nr:metalloregulator ArsR/SmtB family transcription factor [Gemmataceae bacterium]